MNSSISHKNIKSIFCLLLILSTLNVVSCDKNDDTITIFNEKRWKITGCTYNGVNINNESIKELYREPYYIEMFGNGVLTGKLSNNISIKGTWNAEGNSRSIHLFINPIEISNASFICNKIFEILNGVTKYEGDSNVIKLIKDRNNFLILNSNIKSE